MAFILRTSLSDFRANNVLLSNPVDVEWYRYFLDGKASENICPMNAEELLSFLKFTKRNKNNFPGFPYVFNFKENEQPIIDVDKRVLQQDILYSPYLLLGGHLLTSDVKPSSWISEIVLKNSGKKGLMNDHLPFPLLGIVKSE